MYQIRIYVYGQYSIKPPQKFKETQLKTLKIFDSIGPSVKHPLPGNGWMVKNSEPKKMRRKMPTWVTNVKPPKV